MIRKVIFQDAASVIGTFFTAFVLLFMIVGPWLTDYDPLKVNMDEKLMPPSAQHWLGTDELGRDIFARLADGARYSFGTAIAVVAIAATVGIVVGGFCAYIGGWLDNLLMRLCDIFMSFPELLLAMFIAFALGPGLNSTIIALAIAWWPSYARMVRGMVIVIRENLFVESAVAIGASPIYIVLRVILPQAVPLLIVQITMGLGSAIIAASSLSFIGLGAQMPLPEWGAMVGASRNFIFQAWWYGLFPGLAIFMSVIGFSLLGDALQEALNPKKTGKD
ncbi:ABC transporter permease [Paenibacillaceae bacterium WGS1546]|uniref:ABC transporter permease n=1 Tax=Cohnella sp. WGS1546 TaxID=3366810 RepID=UPI00372D2CEA